MSEMETKHEEKAIKSVETSALTRDSEAVENVKLEHDSEAEDLSPSLEPKGKLGSEPATTSKSAESSSPPTFSEPVADTASIKGSSPPAPSSEPGTGFTPIKGLSVPALSTSTPVLPTLTLEIPSASDPGVPEVHSPLQEHNFQSAGPTCDCSEAHYFRINVETSPSDTNNEEEQSQPAATSGVSRSPKQEDDATSNGTWEVDGIFPEETHCDCPQQCSKWLNGPNPYSDRLWGSAESDGDEQALDEREEQQIPEDVVELVEDFIEQLAEELAYEERFHRDIDGLNQGFIVEPVDELTSACAEEEGELGELAADDNRDVESRTPCFEEKFHVGTEAQKLALAEKQPGCAHCPDGYLVELEPIRNSLTGVLMVSYYWINHTTFDGMRVHCIGEMVNGKCHYRSSNSDAVPASSLRLSSACGSGNFQERASKQTLAPEAWSRKARASTNHTGVPIYRLDFQQAEGSDTAAARQQESPLETIRRIARQNPTSIYGVPRPPPQSTSTPTTYAYVPKPYVSSGAFLPESLNNATLSSHIPATRSTPWWAGYSSPNAAMKAIVSAKEVMLHLEHRARQPNQPRDWRDSVPGCIFPDLRGYLKAGFQDLFSGLTDRDAQTMVQETIDWAFGEWRKTSTRRELHMRDLLPFLELEEDDEEDVES